MLNIILQQNSLNILNGIDCFVPIGQALEFSPIWDGYDLLREYCREVEIKT